MTFEELLLDKKLITDTELIRAKKIATEKYQGNIELALFDGGIREDEYLTIKGDYYGIPTASVRLQDVPFEILKYIPADSAQHYRYIPIGLTEGVLHIGITNPSDIVALDALRFIAAQSGLPYKLFIITEKNFDQLFEGYKGPTSEVTEALNEIDLELEAEQEKLSQEKKKETNPADEDKIIEDAPIIKIVAVMLRHAIEGGASDIHIENTGEKVVVRYRVDGLLRTSLQLPLSVYSGIVARVKILAKLRLDEKRKPQDGNFSSKIDNRKIDFRVSTFPTYYGEKVVMRILDSEKGVRSIANLNLTPHHFELVTEAIHNPYGLILITGPTGSGKSTTLYAFLNELDRQQYNVVSLEDPVEYTIPLVSQSQVMTEIGYTFASGLRSILRQDPDIIMVGEIRDRETAQLAIQAALTGHLVFSTLHTNNAAGVVPRLIDMGIDPYLIAPTLILSIAQRLVRATHPNARKEMPIDATTRAFYEKSFASLPPEVKAQYPLKETMFATVPTPEVPSGMKGRMAVHEMFKVDREMQKLIMKGPGEQEMFEMARRKGMLTMREDGFLKALDGYIPMTEVFQLGGDED